ncbi:restriction endonuclease subunit S [Microbulbifer sp. GL-2]|uniref:restriction endonuclease subunit S n=1 Tax=Microbulbifer sp. GL-2 TaxID=2591606 RepID=UPI0011657E4E|nr:restriction endonuclease subunit S [Microbulbifer sp. GL-2]BBM03106.1 hypothetical protein GL2_31800 [Microbulbifer sp. GL-2]
MVPKGWKELTIEQCLIDKTSMAYGILQPGQDVENGIPMIRTVDIGADGLCGTKILRVSEELHLEYKRTELAGSEVLLSVMGTVGRTMVVPSECAGWNVNRALAVMRLNSATDPFYFCEYLKSPFVNGRLIEQAIGSAQKRINLGDLKKYKVRIPPLSEQKKIAQILSTWDKAIDTSEKLLANSRQQKKALMQQLLTGKKRLRDKSGVRFNGEWRPTTIGEISHCFSGGTPSRKKDEYYGGSIPWITSGKLNDRFVTSTNEFITEAGLLNSSAKTITKNTILVAMYGATAGRVAINLLESATINQAILAINLKAGISNSFFFHLLERKMVEAINLVQGGQPNLNASIIKNLRIRIPILEEQEKIAATLSSADQEIETLQQKLDCLKQEKTALMQQLLTGKRRVQVEEAQ